MAGLPTDYGTHLLTLRFVDGHVFIWHKVTGILVQEAEAHHTSCNAVAWNPADPCMFATAGDDGRVKM
jgi:WD40 repeat protein